LQSFSLVAVPETEESVAGELLQIFFSLDKTMSLFLALTILEQLHCGAVGCGREMELIIFEKSPWTTNLTSRVLYIRLWGCPN